MTETRPLPATSPWGGPGHNFIGRRRAWLHRLLRVSPPRVVPEGEARH